MPEQNFTIVCGGKKTANTEKLKKKNANGVRLGIHCKTGQILEPTWRERLEDHSKHGEDRLTKRQRHMNQTERELQKKQTNLKIILKKQI